MTAPRSKRSSAMKSWMKRMVKCVPVLAVLSLLLWINGSRAADGRDFAGFYEVSNVTDLGETVRLTLTVRVHNYSDADVNDSTVTLQDSVLAGTEYGSYADTVSIADRQSVRLSAEFTVSQQEYGRWKEGRPPFLWITYQGSDGTTIRRNIELTSGMVGEEN